MPFNLNTHDKLIRHCLFVASALPAAYMILAYLSSTLGFNPFARLAKVSGHSAMIFILITLGITPVRRWLVWLFSRILRVRWGKRLSDWNLLIKARRMFGVYAFFYGSIHLWVYLYLEMDFYWPDIFNELLHRRFIILGALTWTCLFLLALTSPTNIRKMMKTWWRILHRLMYPLSIFSVMHYYFAVKVTERQQPIIFLLLVFAFLLHRILVTYVKGIRRIDDTGMEASRK